MAPLTPSAELAAVVGSAALPRTEVVKKMWDYIKKKGVPYNVLHDKGFPSIGCQPCTRAVAPGQDVRAGRWWWEDPAQKECGLHVK